MKSNTQFTWPFQLRQLAVMIDAGIAIDAALASLDSTRDAKRRVKLQRAVRLVKRGVGLPDAFLKAQLIGEFDYEMLCTAEEAGRLSDGLNHISERRVKQLQRADSLKASLVLPKTLVFVGAVAGVFVRTASGNQSIAEALISVGIAAAWFYLICYLALNIVRADTRIWMSLLWPYEFIRKRNQWYCLALEYYFYNSLIWQVSAGVPYGTAVKRCSKLLTSKTFCEKTEKASRQMESGTSLSQSLIDEGLVISRYMRQVLLVADESGKHELAIKNELKLQSHRLKQKTENFFKWMPRVFYVVALLFVSKLMVFQ